MLNQEFEGKKIAVYGLGLEGKSTINYIKNNIENYQIFLVDDFAKDLNFYCDARIVIADKTCFKDVDVIIKSPGIVLENDFIYHDKLESQTNLFLKYFSQKCIGITGTKGKSTTTSLIYHILKTYNENVFLVGNIGRPVFDYLNQMNNESLFVYELSCHQLQDVKYSPHIAIFLNCYQEHLDRYITFENYYNAKKNIYKFQNNLDLLYINKELDSNNILSQKTLIGSDITFENKIIAYGKNIIDLNNTIYHLLGEHNFFDIATAYAVAKDFNISDEKFKQALSEFKPLKHRLEYLGKYEDIEFYNDSISTSCESTIAAIKAIKNIDTILLGGLDRGIDYGILLEYLKDANLKNIIFMYQSGLRMSKEFKNHNKNVFVVADLKQAVELSFNITEKNKSVVLSPASASYDSFKNFEHRGETFKNYIKEHI